MTLSTPVTFGGIASARRVLGLSVEDIAREFSAAPSTVERWLAGESTPGDVAAQAMLARLERRVVTP